MSAAVTEDTEDFILGAPGSWYWQGQDFVFDRTRGIGSSDDPQYKTLESPPLEDDTYLGYSTAVGRFGDVAGGKQSIAAGRPRGNMLRGEVSPTRRDKTKEKTNYPKLSLFEIAGGVLRHSTGTVAIFQFDKRSSRLVFWLRNGRRRF